MTPWQPLVAQVYQWLPWSTNLPTTSGECNALIAMSGGRAAAAFGLILAAVIGLLAVPVLSDLQDTGEANTSGDTAIFLANLSPVFLFIVVGLITGAAVAAAAAAMHAVRGR